MKLLLLTTQPNWESWDRKLAACRGGIGIAKNVGKVIIDKEKYTYGTPEVSKGKLNRGWFQKLTNDAKKRGYDGVVLHFSRAENNRWGLKRNLRGCAINDEYMGEMWVNADEDDKIRYDSGRKVDRFVKVFLHEVSHWMAKRLLKQPDRTHYWDYERELTFFAFLEYKFPKGLIDKLTGLFVKERMYCPLPYKYWRSVQISQGFGVENLIYASGIHAGVDFAIPEGTPIYAPKDGEITKVWENHRTLGNACVFEFYFQGRLRSLRIAHMKRSVEKGTFRRGDQIGLSGNTGASTGPHAHIELWIGGYDVEVLYDKHLILGRLSNPYYFFKLLSTNYK